MTDEERKAKKVASDAQYRISHKAERAAYREPYKDKQRISQKKYRLVHHEELLARKKAAYPRYYVVHGEEAKGRASEYYALHVAAEKKRSSRYSAAHPEKKQLCALKRRALKYANTPIEEMLTEPQWHEILETYRHRCAYCGRKMGRLTVDHVIPLSRGGKHSKDNVVPACLHCNTVKNVKTPEEWVGLEVQP
jgi:5-methylcytosine-specific restriction endonuclease McrA